MEWKHYKMDELIEEISMGPFGSDVKKEFYVDNGVPILNGSNLQGFKLQEDSFGYLTKEKADSLKKCNAHRGDIIVTHRGTLGQIVYVPVNSKYDRYVISQSQFRFRCKADLVDVQYLVYYFHTREGQYKILANASQVGVPALARATSTFRLIDIKLPSLKDQRRIASILSSLDRKIELNNKINADLEEMAQAIFKNWFVDFEPFKDGKFVDSELGMIPEGWKVGRLFDIAEIFDKKRKPLSGNVREKMDKIYPYYGATSCMDFVDDYIFDGIYTLIGEDGSVVKENGLPYMQYVWGKMWVNNHAHILQGKNGYSTEMIHALLSITNIKFLVTGAVQAKLSQGNMQKIFVAIPPKNVLDEIRPVIDNLYSKIRINTDENSRLSLLRDTLLPRLMSGELEVPE